MRSAGRDASGDTITVVDSGSSGGQGLKLRG